MDADIVIIGAGVIGLAIASELATGETLILERNDRWGEETSSRNSGVLHAGIYYEPGSLKARFCVEGNCRIYELARQHGIDHIRTEKLVVANDADDIAELTRLLQQGTDNGVEQLQLIEEPEISRLEPDVSARYALHIPSTGVIDQIQLMRTFLSIAQRRGAQLVCHTRVVDLKRAGEGWKVSCESAGEPFAVTARLVINCSGLHADATARLAGIDTDAAGYRQYYSKGEYASVLNHPPRRVNRLVYPLPDRARNSLGIHYGFDTRGSMFLGPNAHYVDQIDYSFDESHMMEFEEAGWYFPWIQKEDLAPRDAGVRPKLSGPGQKPRDFVIRHEADRGLSGLINLVGIDSPGLTSSPAIAKYVAEMAREIL